MVPSWAGEFRELGGGTLRPRVCSLSEKMCVCILKFCVCVCCVSFTLTHTHTDSSFERNHRARLLKVSRLFGMNERWGGRS